jgi:ribonuclease HI
LSPTHRIEIFTDGSSSGNPGPGGWAALICDGARTREISGGYRRTTNNRMELLAAIRALESLSAASQVDLYTDSKYLVDNIASGRLDSWQARGWKHTATRPLPNADLWKQLKSFLDKHRVTFHWVQGHRGHPQNERANLLAVRAGQAVNLLADQGYEETNRKGSQPDLFTPQSQAARPENPPLPRAGKITRAGQPCRKCGTPVEKAIPSRKRKPGQAYYYAYYFHCPNCGTNYFTDEARREL